MSKKTLALTFLIQIVTSFNLVSQTIDSLETTFSNTSDSVKNTMISIDDIYIDSLGSTGTTYSDSILNSQNSSEFIKLDSTTIVNKHKFVSEIDTIDILSVKNKELAIAHLNHAVSLFAKIKEFDNLTLLQDELDDVINNLSIEGIVDFYYVMKLRQKMIRSLQQFVINETEKQRLDQKNERKQARLIKEAAANALSGTYVTLNPYSLIANVGLASLRAGLDMSIKKDLLEEELDDKKWNLTKSNLLMLSDLRSDYLEVSQILFKEYELKDIENLTEKRSEMLANSLKTSNMELRLKKLIYDQSYFQHYAPYWYFLGDAYQETGDLDNAINAYNKYLKLYNQAPIYRIDKRTGIIKLRLLKIGADKKEISYLEAKKYIKEIKFNLPFDGGAYQYCASILAENYGRKDEAMDLLQESILKDNVSNKSTSALSLLLIHKNNPEIRVNLNLVAEILGSIKNIDLSLILMYYSETENQALLNNIKDIKLSIDRSIFSEEYDEFTLKLPNNIYFDKNKLNLIGKSWDFEFNGEEPDLLILHNYTMKVKEYDGINKDDFYNFVEEVVEDVEDKTNKNNINTFTDDDALMNSFFTEISPGILIPINDKYSDTDRYPRLRFYPNQELREIENYVKKYYEREYYKIIYDIESKTELDYSKALNNSNELYFERRLLKPKVYKNLELWYFHLASEQIDSLLIEDQKDEDIIVPTFYKLTYDNFTFIYVGFSDDDEELDLVAIKNGRNEIFVSSKYTSIKVSDLIKKIKKVL